MPEPDREPDRCYFRQLLTGRDFAKTDAVAHQMVNFVYLVGDRKTGEALLVDPAYNVQDLLDVAAADGMRVTGVLATHFHPDHIGGDLFGMEIQGIKHLLELQGMKVHIQRVEAQWVKEVTGVSDTDLALHDSGDKVEIGDISVQLIHTPGHTPGSQCFLVENRLVAGDTLFLDGCGRTDLPGGDPRQLYQSIHQRLAHVPDDAMLYPGHLYSRDASGELGATRRNNMVFKPKSEEEWLRMFGSAF
ncbi:MAG: MBL fold metallo-hydrolase [Planctomycetota bacterium]|jgi:glyoxylase-like metal-dependent hydrolase (beta-lactamase superfamily II)